MKHFCAGGFDFPLGNKVYVMGILNVTPDSFSDGGEFLEPGRAVAHAIDMAKQGADLIDVGGQSTRPGFTRISAEEELARLEPVLPLLKRQLPGLPISLDTFYPEVARRSIELGVDIINDVNGFEDPEMWKIAAQTGCGCIIMHPCGCDGDILKAIRAFMEKTLKTAKEYGVEPSHICFDPGIGFGKTYEQNLSILANIGKLVHPECGFLTAASRKMFIGQASGNPEFKSRAAGTVAAHSVAAFCGADIVRAHDVPEAVQAARVTGEIRGYRVG